MLRVRSRYLPLSASRKRGAITLFVLLFILVALSFFQSYIHFSTADYATGHDLILFKQKEVDKQNLQVILKEALLTYYEGGQMGQPMGSLPALITDQLNLLNSSDVTFALTSYPSLPSNSRDLFWPFISGSSTALNGSFRLTETAAERSFNRVNDFLDPDLSALQVTNGSNGYFVFTFSRTESGKAAETISITARLWQVPVCDFNLFTYSTSVPSSIPATPPVLSSQLQAQINSGAIRTLTLSAIPSSSLSGNAGTEFPYAYRELSSATSSVWQYLFYTMGYYRRLVQSRAPFVHDVNRVIDYDPAVPGIRLYAQGSTVRWELDIDDLESDVILVSGGGNPLAEVELVDSNDSSTVGNAPLVVYAFNRGNIGEMILRITPDSTDGLVRPLLLIGENACLDAGKNMTMNGAVYLEDYDSVNHAISGGDYTFNNLNQGSRALTVYGSVAWKSQFALSNPSANSLRIYAPSGANPVRSLSPRFLVVDTF